MLSASVPRITSSRKCDALPKLVHGVTCPGKRPSGDATTPMGSTNSRSSSGLRARTQEALR